MTTRTLNLDDSLYQYLLDVSLRDSPVKARLRAETARLPMSRWQVAPEQGQFLALLVGLTGAKRILEVGTFTGYSALCMAEALPEGGHILCCDLPGEYNDIARSHWHDAGVDSRIELRLGPALATLEAWLRAISKVLSTWYSSTPTRRITSPTWSTRWLCCVWAGWWSSTTYCGVDECWRPTRRVRIPARSSNSTWP